MSTSRQFTIKKHFPTKFKVSAYGYYNSITQVNVSNSITKNISLNQWTLPELTYTASNQCPGTVSLNAGDFPDYTYRNSDLKVLMPYNNGQTYITPTPVQNAYLVNNNCTINGGVATGFSDSNGLYINRPLTSTNIDAIIKAKFYEFSGYEAVLCVKEGNERDIGLGSSGVFSIYYGGNNAGSTTPELNTYYFLRLKYDDGHYKLYSLLAGSYTYATLPSIENWTLEFDLDAAFLSTGETLCLGQDVHATGEYLRGEIDLNQSKILLDGQIFWEYPQTVIQTMNLYGCLDSADTSSAHTYTGYSLKNGNNQRMVLSNSAPSVSGFTTYKLRDITIPAHDTYTYSETSQEQPYTLFNIVGNLSFSSGVASDFGESDYMTCTGFSPITSGTFLFRVYFTSTGTNTILKDLSTDYEKYFACDDYYGIYDNGWTKSSNYQITDQWHFIRLEIKGGVSSLYTLVDNNYTIDTLPPLENWRFECSVNSNLFSDASSFQIGANLNWTPGYLRGQLDLSKSQIIINDEIYWQRIKIVPVWTRN